MDSNNGKGNTVDTNNGKRDPTMERAKIDKVMDFISRSKGQRDIITHLLEKQGTLHEQLPKAGLDLSILSSASMRTVELLLIWHLLESAYFGSVSTSTSTAKTLKDYLVEALHLQDTDIPYLMFVRVLGVARELFYAKQVSAKDEDIKQLISGLEELMNRANPAKKVNQLRNALVNTFWTREIEDRNPSRAFQLGDNKYTWTKNQRKTIKECCNSVDEVHYSGDFYKVDYEQQSEKVRVLLQEWHEESHVEKVMKKCNEDVTGLEDVGALLHILHVGLFKIRKHRTCKQVAAEMKALLKEYPALLKLPDAIARLLSDFENHGDIGDVYRGMLNDLGVARCQDQLANTVLTDQ